MLKTFAVILGIIAFGIALMAVRLFFGKPFVHTHIEGKRDMQARGIHCVTHQDRQARRERRTKVKEAMVKN